MRNYTTTEARKNIYQLVQSVQDSHEPVQITGKNGSAILLSTADWQAIQETLYLMSIPGMHSSIVEGLKTPLDDCDEEIEW